MSLTYGQTKALLSEDLGRGPLPGGAAQRLMAPVPRPGWHPGGSAAEGRPAAVLILIYPRTGGADGAAGVVLTERTGTVEWHKRQISFPGGTAEPGETPEETALREAAEEVAIPASLPRLLGRLSPLWVPATGFTIQPIVAASDRRPALVPNPREVARVIEAPLERLLDPGAVRVVVSVEGRRWTRAPYFDLEDAPLWGASAMITAELLTLLGWPGPPAQPPEDRDWPERRTGGN